MWTIRPVWRRLRRSISRPPPGTTSHHLPEECRPVPISRHPAMLIGNWRVERKIIDQRGGGTLLVAGQAIISASACDEYGQFQMTDGRVYSLLHHQVSME